MPAKFMFQLRQAQNQLVLMIVPTPEPVYIRPLRAPLRAATEKPITLAEAKRIFASTESEVK